MQNNITTTGQVPKKKRGCCGCLVVFFIIGVIGAIIAGVSQNFSLISTKSDSSASSETSSAEELLKFDAQAWDAFITLCNSHNALMSAMDSYADGKVTAVDFYNFCKDAEEIFRDASVKLNPYKATEDQKTYLNPLRSMATDDQLAVKALMKYLDSKATSDLAEAQDHIARVLEAVNVFASNRGKFLVKAGLSEEEIQQKLEEDFAKLEQ